ncbi:MAG: hypothetical protein EWV67_22805 [Microcystis sp. M_QC_C_20170808_M2Col]|nr:MAG: hypothetical protein EWV67_22805 [Microcystis sp. M_QC_C_20170808_M2Col]
MISRSERFAFAEESARVLSPSDRFLKVYFLHFFSKKVPKPFSSKASTDIQPDLIISKGKHLTGAAIINAYGFQKL